MSDFNLASFAAHLGTMTAALHHHEEHAMEKAARLIEAEAKREIGHYQGPAGEFVGWADLAPFTIEDRLKKGFSDDEPLLRTGELRDSIEHRVHGLEAMIGSDSDIAVWQELGTKRIPPRTFLGGAAVRKGEATARLLGHGFVSALVGKDVFEGSFPIKGD